MATKEKVETTQEQEILADLNSKYVYVLAQKSEARGRTFDIDGRPLKDPEYKQRQNLLLRSSIVWPGGKDPFSGKERAKGKYLIRYYDGCSTLFIDDQPQQKEVIDTLMASTRELHFIRGHLEVYGYDVMLRNYLDWASWNEGSPYRINKVDAIYKLLDSEAQLRIEADKLSRIKEALNKAETATVKHMRVHAKFLDIADVDLITGKVLSDISLRTLYGQAAMNNTDLFLKTFNDKTIHIKHWIDQALQSGEISTTLIPNKAVWAKKGIEICDISGLQSKEGILNKLIEYCQSKEGEEFKAHLEALYN